MRHGEGETITLEMASSDDDDDDGDGTPPPPPPTDKRPRPITPPRESRHESLPMVVLMKGGGSDSDDDEAPPPPPPPPKEEGEWDFVNKDHDMRDDVARVRKNFEGKEETKKVRRSVLVFCLSEPARARLRLLEDRRWCYLCVSPLRLRWARAQEKKAREKQAQKERKEAVREGKEQAKALAKAKKALKEKQGKGGDGPELRHSTVEQMEMQNIKVPAGSLEC